MPNSDKKPPGMGNQDIDRINEVLEDEVAKKRAPKLLDTTKSVKNWCFHNTKKLLQKYRVTQMCISAAMDDLENACMDKLGARFDSMAEFARHVDIDLSGTYLESRMRSMEQNRRMLGFIDRALWSMHKYDLNGEEFYWIIFLKYMAAGEDKCVNDNEVIDRLVEKGFPVSSSTFYRRLNLAIGTLSGILWGYTARDTLLLTEVLHKVKFGEQPND
jgi:hypothetical protein